MLVTGIELDEHQNGLFQWVPVKLLAIVKRETFHNLQNLIYSLLVFLLDAVF
jgi:hypothetical protein